MDAFSGLEAVLKLVVFMVLGFMSVCAVGLVYVLFKGVQAIFL